MGQHHPFCDCEECQIKLKLHMLREQYHDDIRKLTDKYLEDFKKILAEEEKK